MRRGDRDIDDTPRRHEGVGAALARAMEARGATQADMAARTGLSRPRVSSLLAQADAKASTVARLAGALGYELRLVPASRAPRQGEIGLRFPADGEGKAREE